MNLENAEEFFKYNIEIKNIIVNCYPPTEMYAHSDETAIQYSKKLEDNLELLEFYFSRIANTCYSNTDLNNYITELFKKYKEKLINCSTNLDRLKNFYQTCLYDMREGFNDKVRNNYIGYFLFKYNLVEEAKTINELLHVIHSSIVNDENFYQKIPALSKKKNIDGYNISLRGNSNEISEQIYNNFPIELQCGDVDIISFKNDKVLIMARDLGHALTIEITKENEDYFVNYFIPKICNIDMVNQLKGVKKVDENSKYTIGSFKSSKDNLANELIEFVKHVPGDRDMPDVYINREIEEVGHLKR